MLSLLALLLFSSHAQAEFCPAYNGGSPTMVVEAAEYKFFFYPRSGTNQDPNVIQVVKDGAISDVEKVYFWADDQSDETTFYNLNIQITCTFGLDFITAKYADPRGTVYEYFKGDCRQVKHAAHPLVCDS
ncbi:MAG: hypothetical protein ACXWQO_14955, partial [Bdellovibrionota bacterium]